MMYLARGTPNHFIYLPFHTKPLTLSVFHSKFLCLFIISSGMGYQRCLIAQYNEHPYSLIWVFAADKRKWNMSGWGVLQNQKKKKKTSMKYNVISNKHLTSKSVDQHMHACASMQSGRLWVFTVEKTYMKYGTASKKTYNHKVSDQHVHPHILSRILGMHERSHEHTKNKQIK